MKTEIEIARELLDRAKHYEALEAIAGSLNIKATIAVCERLIKVEEALEFSSMAMSHAVHLGYCGEGSTKGLIEDAIAKCEALAAIEKLKKVDSK